jgi:hypothetical protein
VRREGNIAVRGCYIGPADEIQEITAAGGAGSPRQKEGDVARGEGDNGEELGRWEDPQATRGHVQKLEVELGYCAGGERRWQSETEGKQGARGRRNRQVSEGLICNFRNF